MDATTGTDIDNLTIVRRYLEAIESGATGEALAAFFTSDVVQEEFPNRIVPNGARRDLAGLQEAAIRGQQVVSQQRIEVRSALAVGDRVAVEILWTGALAIPVGTLPAGGEMHAHCAMFFDLRDGRIAAQRNYDCFDPW
jgi:ketosteroid isomerase-like protein